MSYKIGFIGAGNMGGCLISAATETTSVDDICVFDKDTQKAEHYKNTYGVSFDSLETVLDSKIIVIGVKPQGYKALVSEIKEKINSRRDEFVIVSMAAGITIDSICEMFGKRIPVIRIMPNMACNTNEGIIVYDINECVSENQEVAFKAVFKCAGLIDRLDESLIDAACAVTGCGPAFAYMFIEALADGAVACGLPRDKAVKYSAQMLKGAGATVLCGSHPEDLKDKVCSPGGSTIEGVLALEENGFRGSVNSAVIASYNKNIELGK